jgi:hypothetical protein
LNKRKASLAATLLTVVVVGCGASGSTPSLSTFKQAFAASKAQVRQLGADLGATLQRAATTTDAQLAAEFDQLANRAKTQAAGLRKLDPPAKFKAELSQFSSSLDSVATDLGRIAGAADAHNVKRARAATATLITDAAKVRTADNVLTAGLGLPKTG